MGGEKLYNEEVHNHHDWRVFRREISDSGQYVSISSLLTNADREKLPKGAVTRVRLYLQPGQGVRVVHGENIGKDLGAVTDYGIIHNVTGNLETLVEDVPVMDPHKVGLLSISGTISLEFALFYTS